MTFTNSETIPDPAFLTAIRQKSATFLLEEISSLLVKVHHPHSGKIMEAIMMHLPDDQFDMLSALVLGHEQEDLVQQFCAHIAVRLACMVGLNATYAKCYFASQNVGLLILCEQRRRAGEVTYDFPNDFFADIVSKNPQIMTPTKEGIEKLGLFLLNRFDSKVKQ